MFPVTNPGQSHSMLFNLTDELPKTVARTLNQGSIPTSMDFHPVQQTLLLGWFPLASFNDHLIFMVAVISGKYICV